MNLENGKTMYLMLLSDLLRSLTDNQIKHTKWSFAPVTSASWAPLVQSDQLWNNVMFMLLHVAYNVTYINLLCYSYYWSKLLQQYWCVNLCTGTHWSHFESVRCNKEPTSSPMGCVSQPPQKLPTFICSKMASNSWHWKPTILYIVFYSEYDVCIGDVSSFLLQ